MFTRMCVLRDLRGAAAV